MRLRIDARGRLVIPKALRGEAGIAPGATVDATFRDGRIDLEAPPAAVLLDWRGRVLVAVPEAPTPTLRHEVAQATIDALGHERARATIDAVMEEATPYDPA